MNLTCPHELLYKESLVVVDKLYFKIVIIEFSMFSLQSPDYEIYLFHSVDKASAKTTGPM